LYEAQSREEKDASKGKMTRFGEAESSTEMWGLTTQSEERQPDVVTVTFEGGAKEVHVVVHSQCTINCV